MDNILNQKARSFFDEVDLFKQTANTFTVFESIKTKEKYVSPFYAENGIKPGQNIVTDKPISDFNFTGIDENGNEGHEYATKVFEGESGIKVHEEFESNLKKINPYYIHFYFEKLNPQRLLNFSGRLCLFNIGKTYYNELIAKFPKKSIDGYVGDIFELTINSLESEAKYTKKVVDYKYKGNNLSEVDIYNALVTAIAYKVPIGKEMAYISNLNNQLAEAVKEAAAKVASVQIKEERYLNPDKEDTYNPILGGNTPLDFLLQIGLSVFQSAISKGLQFLKDLDAEKFLPEGFKNIIKKFDAFTIQINNALTTIKDKIAKIGGEIIKLSNAFLCGLINGLLSLVEFLLDIIAFIIGLEFGAGSYEDYAKSRKYIEVFEEVLNIMFTEIPIFLISFNKLILDLATSDDAKISELFDFVKDLKGIAKQSSSGITQYHIAYYTGNVIFEVIIGVLLAVFTGGMGNVAKASGSLSQKSAKFLKILGEEVLSSLTFGVSDMLVLFRKFILSFAKACEKGFKGFMKWLRSLLNTNGKHFDEVLDEVDKLDLDKVLINGKKLQKGAGDINKTFAENAGIKTERWISETKVFGQSTNHTCVATSLRMVLKDKIL